MRGFSGSDLPDILAFFDSPGQGEPNYFIPILTINFQVTYYFCVVIWSLHTHTHTYVYIFTVYIGYRMITEG